MALGTQIICSLVGAKVPRVRPGERKCGQMYACLLLSNKRKTCIPAGCLLKHMAEPGVPNSQTIGSSSCYYRAATQAHSKSANLDQTRSSDAHLTPRSRLLGKCCFAISFLPFSVPGCHYCYTLCPTWI